MLATDVRWPAATQAGPQELTEEDTMNQHPTIAAALAEQRRATLMAEAGTARLARAARNGGNGRPRRPVRWLSTDRRPGTSGARRGLRLRPARAR